MKILFSTVLLFILQVCLEAKIVDYEYVTCGSVLKLLNAQHNVRLHSHEVKYGQGSGQQSVTGVENSDDHNSYWQIKERSGSAKSCVRGRPIKCGQTIRLMHLSTGKNLHSHHFSSPLSHNLEVSAFGDELTVDEGDNWVLKCKNSREYWTRKEYVSLKHSNTQSFLYVSGDRYGRPIEGQAEISCANHMSTASDWIAAEGIFVKPSMESTFDSSSNSSDFQRDEL